MVISEVLQTSSTDTTTPQGNLAGHGITVDRQYIAKYTSSEFGLIMGLMSIMPKPAYQQGINRQWLRETKYDFYFPEFANLSEQPIMKGEIFVTDNGVVENKAIFGYQGRYDEMRYKPNMIHGTLRDTMKYWHLGRIFAETPVLNESFLECDPRNDIFAVPSEPGFIINYANKIRAIRPLPVQSNPGLIDHN